MLMLGNWKGIRFPAGRISMLDSTRLSTFSSDLCSSISKSSLWSLILRGYFYFSADLRSWRRTDYRGLIKGYSFSEGIGSILDILISLSSALLEFKDLLGSYFSLSGSLSLPNPGLLILLSLSFPFACPIAFCFYS